MNDDNQLRLYTSLGPPPDAFQAYISESSVPCVLAMYYTLQVVDNYGDQRNTFQNGFFFIPSGG